MTTKKALTGMMIAAAMLFGGSQSAQATVAAPGASTSGDTNVNVNIPDFIILHYYSDLTLNFAAPTQSVDEGAKAWDNVAWSTGSYDGDIQLTEDATEVNDGNKVNVKMKNLWAVRGFSNSGTADITITNTDDTMENSGSLVVMEDLKVTTPSTGGDTSITVPLKGISKNNATKGGVSMTLNFNGTTKSGMHSGGMYTITASTI